MGALYHYTDLNALIGILRKERIFLRATNILYQNDPKEVKRGIDLISRNIGCQIDPLSFRSYYITSFSECEDNLSMWRAYADNGKGCAIGLDSSTLSKAFKSENSFFKHCEYPMPEEFPNYYKPIKSLIKEHVVQMPPSQTVSNKQLKDQYIENEIVRICTTTKHNAYKEEMEWRGVYFHEHCSEKSNIRHTVKNGYIVPFIEIKLPKEALRGIIVGPAAPQLAVQSVGHLLWNNNYITESSQLGLQKSKIPYIG